MRLMLPFPEWKPVESFRAMPVRWQRGMHFATRCRFTKSILKRCNSRLLDLHGQSLVYFEDSLAGTSRHVIDQMLGCRGVPLHNNNSVFQKETSVSVADVKHYLRRLFREHATLPISEARLQRTLDFLGSEPERVATRRDCILAISEAAGIKPSDRVTPLFKDVSKSESPQLAKMLTAWQKRRFLPPKYFEPAVSPQGSHSLQRTSTAICSMSCLPKKTAVVLIR